MPTGDSVVEIIYPAGPCTAPENLTQATRAYKLRAWTAVAGLAIFVAVYLGLSGWFIWNALRLFRSVVDGNGNLAGILAALCSAFFAVFMLKALFFLKRDTNTEGTIEVTAAQQPQLFGFLNRLADEAKAPKPHRVFLSARVNAAVFYDLSLFNLLWPSRKNLEIGLALVNVLTLGELKAVLAHEFGHFAQRSMAVGRWVYVAQQVAAQIISRRDALDKFLESLSRIDIRIAWIAWIMRLIVWSIRSLMESLFRGVVLAQRALSREMELQADLVAVSLTGSDALVHALHKLKAADEAWDRTLRFAGSELSKQRPVGNLFLVQQRVIEQMSRVLNRPDFCRPPPLPAENAASHRVFTAGLAVPPRMWATHPANAERENNAKRVYVKAPLDDRAAWSLFADAVALQEKMSLQMAPKAEVQPAPIEESLRHLDQDFEMTYLDRRYRGAYLSRSPVRRAAAIEDLYKPRPAISTLRAELDSLYPESLAKTLEQLRILAEERQSLEALREGTAQASEDSMRYRGQALTRRQLPAVISQLQAEIDTALDTVEAHEARCRTVHLAAAEQFGNGWPEFLQGRVAVLHYADHTEANLRDAQGFLANIYAVVTARRKVKEKALARLVSAANEVHEVLLGIWRQAPDVALDPALARRLGIERWQQAFGEFKLPAPTRANIGEWLRVIDGWINSTAGNLSKLRLHALDSLLAAEAQVAGAVRNNADPGPAPGAPCQAPSRYPTLLPGRERARQKQLHWWDRFQLADGMVALIARLAVALCIVGGVLFFGQRVGDATIVVYNGLPRPVSVTVGKESLQVAAYGHAKMDVSPSSHYTVSARTLDGIVIESFDADPSVSLATYIYDIAGIAPLVSWTAVYGNVPPVEPRRLGAPRWSTSTADVLFEQPPSSISSKTGGGSRTVLSAFADHSPQQQLELLGNDTEAVRAVANGHARWDPLTSPHIYEWLSLASASPEFGSILAARLRESPDDVLLHRFEQDTSKGSEHAAVCERDQAAARAHPQNGNLQYLATRCIADRIDRDTAFDQFHLRFPHNAWLQQAVGYGAAEQGRWEEAIAQLEQARPELPAMAPFIAVDSFRLYRVLGRDSEPVALDLERQSERLRQLLAVESGGDQPKDPAKAYHELAGGHLNAALADAGPDPQDIARMRRLVAASDGATRQQIDAALALPDNQGIDSDSAWSALGLALRLHRDPSPYLEIIRKRRDHDDATERAIRFVESVTPGLSDSEIQKQLTGLDPELRGQAYTAATVSLGANALPEWRAMARKLLFASERPYFN